MSKKIRKLTKRQDEILALFEKRDKLSVSDIFESIKSSFEKVSKITINRDLRKLVETGFVIGKGRGRGFFYELSPAYNFIKPIDVEKYFKIKTDEREIKEKFNFAIFPILKNVFTEEEKKYLNSLNKGYQKNIKNLSESLLKREFERMVIELSWKSSQIEGNTYSLLETEVLIKENKEAKGHKKEEAMMILNHKKTFDYIRNHENDFKTVSVSKIENIHYLLTANLGISRNIRKKTVGIVGTKYRPMDNEFQIKEAMEKTCILINQEKNPFAKALLLSAMVAYIQPFEDGNKRTSRLFSNAILVAYDICPLSYRSVSEVEYKKAVILFYEQNNINYFKKLFIEQFDFAVKNYFRA